MAIIECPVCHKRISSISPTCPHCGANPEAETGTPRRKSPYLGPTGHYLISCLLALAGGLAYFRLVMSGGAETGAAKLSVALLAVGMIWYVAARIGFWRR